MYFDVVVRPFGEELGGVFEAEFGGLVLLEFDLLLLVGNLGHVVIINIYFN